MAAHAQSAADQLGPATNQQDTGPSTSTSQLLQPASPTTSQSLQSADAIEGGIPQVTNNSDLQAAGGQSTVKDFAGSDNSTHQTLPAPVSQSRTWDWILLAIAVVAAVGIWISEQRQARPQSQ